MELSARHLALHGAIVLLVGLLCGGPYMRAMNGRTPAHIQHAWRAAHAILPIGATLMLAVSAVLSSFSVRSGVKWFITGSLAVSAYAFCLSLPLAAMLAHRELSTEASRWARLVHVGKMVGAGASVVAAAAMIYASVISL